MNVFLRLIEEFRKSALVNNTSAREGNSASMSDGSRVFIVGLVAGLSWALAITLLVWMVFQ